MVPRDRVGGVLTLEPGALAPHIVEVFIAEDQSVLLSNFASGLGSRTPFNAIQIGPHTMLDEAIDRSLDLIQETAAINVLMIYSHTYHGDIRKPAQFLARRCRRAGRGNAHICSRPHILGV
jgi:hypothetical protein